jgi:hypothetical protein
MGYDGTNQVMCFFIIFFKTLGPSEDETIKTLSNCSNLVLVKMNYVFFK